MKIFKTIKIIFGCILMLILPASCSVDSVDKLERSFDPSPCPATPSIIYGGHEYPTIQIGNQCWLQENLNIGTQIHSSEDAIDNGIIEKYCYKNDSINCEYHGGLYVWDEMMQYVDEENTKGICPDGWHIPSVSEMQILIDFTGNDWKKLSYYDEDNNLNNFEIEDYNQSGFSLFATGIKPPNSNEFSQEQYYFRLWTSTFTSNSEAECFGYGEVLISQNKNYAFPVRCIKD